jgi:LPXTG-motif cell wall-anchored protein
VPLVPLVRRFAVLLAAILFCAPVAAIAQTSTSTIEQQGAGVSTQPPVDLGPGDDEPQANTPPPAAAPPAPAANGDLPNTGSDPRLLFLAGVALMFVGVGLRLRTADADLY